jgi:hypothetical protein
MHTEPMSRPGIPLHSKILKILLGLLIGAGLGLKCDLSAENHSPSF